MDDENPLVEQDQEYEYQVTVLDPVSRQRGRATVMAKNVDDIIEKIKPYEFIGSFRVIE